MSSASRAPRFPRRARIPSTSRYDGRRPLTWRSDMRLVSLALLTCLPVAAAGFRAAAVKVDITPQTSQWLMGYNARRSTGVHGRIYHRVVAMEAGGVAVLHGGQRPVPVFARSVRRRGAGTGARRHSAHAVLVERDAHACCARSRSAGRLQGAAGTFGPRMGSGLRGLRQGRADSRGEGGANEAGAGAHRLRPGNRDGEHQSPRQGRGRKGLAGAESRRAGGSPDRADAHGAARTAA